MLNCCFKVNINKKIKEGDTLMLTTNYIYFIFMVIVVLIIVFGIGYASIKCKHDEKKYSPIILSALKFSLKFLLVPIFVSMFLFIGTNMIQEKINAEFQKDNSPLILLDNIHIDNSKNNNQLTISIPYKQGNVAKAGIYLFTNNSFNKNQKYDNIKYIPIKFDQKREFDKKRESDKKRKFDENERKLIASVPLKKEIKKIEGDSINSTQKEIEYDQTIQFCVVIKDYKGNIIKKYCIIRPSYQANMPMFRSITVDNRTFVNKQKCSNKLDEMKWTVDIGSNDAIEYDINILKNSNSHQMVKNDFSPEFEFATKSEQQLPASKWNEIDDKGKHTGKTLADYQPKAKFNATPKMTFIYYMPTDKEIEYNMQAINDICREY